MGGRQLEGIASAPTPGRSTSRWTRPRAAVHAARIADSRRLWRRSQGREPVRQFRRRGRYPAPAAQLALPDDPPRPVGRRSAGAAQPLRHRARRPHHPRTRADDEVRLSLHPESRDRPADLRRRRAQGAAERRPGRSHFPTQPIPVKPPPLARVTYKPEDLVTASDTTAEHAKACAALVREDRRRHQRRPVHAVAATAPRSAAAQHAGVSRRARRRELGRHGIRSQPRDCCSSPPRTSARSAGWSRRPDGRSYDKRSRGRPHVRRADRRAAAGRARSRRGAGSRRSTSSTGDVAWQVPLGITEQLPAEKQNTGRPAPRGADRHGRRACCSSRRPTTTASARSTSKSGAELWVTRLERRGNANPITYQGSNGKQYVAIAATETLVVFSLP